MNMLVRIAPAPLQFYRPAKRHPASRPFQASSSRSPAPCLGGLGVFCKLDLVNNRNNTPSPRRVIFIRTPSVHPAGSFLLSLCRDRRLHPPRRHSCPTQKLSRIQQAGECLTTGPAIMASSAPEPAAVEAATTSDDQQSDGSKLRTFLGILKRYVSMSPLRLS
jgi:hypothetical protein